MEQNEREILWFSLTQLPPDVQEALSLAVQKYNNVEDFTSAIMVGPCPKCAGEKTRDWDDIGLDDATVGTCLECGYTWCLECGDALETWPCPHWEKDEKDGAFEMEIE